MLGGSEGLILIAVIVLLFGGSQIPKLAKNLGLAQKELREAMKGDDEPAPTPSDSANQKSETTEASDTSDASSTTQGA